MPAVVTISVINTPFSAELGEDLVALPLGIRSRLFLLAA
jgi:hypothetical protein